MEFTLENIRNTSNEARANLIKEGYEVIKRHIEEAAMSGEYTVNIPRFALGPNGYLLTHKHICWLKELGFKAKAMEDDYCAYLYIDWED